MEQPITYHQLLAQTYEENASNMLAYHQTTYEDENVDAHERDGYYEVEDSHRFQEFAGNRNTEDLLPKARDFEDKGKASVRYKKDVITRVYNIDTRYRAFYDGKTVKSAVYSTSNPNYQELTAPKDVPAPPATHFLFQTDDIVRNAIAVKLSSLELPNRFYNVYKSRGNTSFMVRQLPKNSLLNMKTGWKNGSATQGEYIHVYLDSKNDGYYYNNISIVNEIEDALNRRFGGTDEDGNVTKIVFKTSKTSEGQMIIRQLSETTYPNGDSLSPEDAYPTGEDPAKDFKYQFYFEDRVDSTEGNQIFNTLPECLGFQEYNYELNSNASIVSEDYIDMNADTYIYLAINDWATVTPQTQNDTYFTVFAKIPITVDKGKMIVDNDVTNTTLKTYHFIQPTNIKQMEIRLLDRLGNEISMDKMVNWSMTLEIDEVVSQSLYEKLREL